MRFKSLFALFTILLGVFFCVGCTSNAGTDEDNTAVTIVSQQATTHEQALRLDQIREGRYWAEYWRDGSAGYGYIVYDKRGKEIMRDNQPVSGGFAEFTLVSENLLRVDMPGGSESRSTRFFDLNEGSYSAVYWNIIAFGHGKVAYLSTNFSALIIHNVIDPSEDHIDFHRNFSGNSSIGAPRANYLVFPFTIAEFLDKKHLHVIYLNRDGKFTEETFDLE